MQEAGTVHTDRDSLDRPAAEILPSHGPFFSDLGPATSASAQRAPVSTRLSPSPHSYWEAVEREGAGSFEAPVWATSNPFALGLNPEPAPGLLGRAGMVALTDRKRQEAFHQLQSAWAEGS